MTGGPLFIVILWKENIKLQDSEYANITDFL